MREYKKYTSFGKIKQVLKIDQVEILFDSFTTVGYTINLEYEGFSQVEFKLNTLKQFEHETKLIRELLK